MEFYSLIVGLFSGIGLGLLGFSLYEKDSTEKDSVKRMRDVMFRLDELTGHVNSFRSIMQDMHAALWAAIPTPDKSKKRGKK